MRQNKKKKYQKVEEEHEMLYFLLRVNITQKATSIKHYSGYIHMDIRSRFIDLSQLIKAEMYKKI